MEPNTLALEYSLNSVLVNSGETQANKHNFTKNLKEHIIESAVLIPQILIVLHWTRL
jgi:hypothetical protein